MRKYVLTAATPYANQTFTATGETENEVLMQMENWAPTTCAYNIVRTADKVQVAFGIFNPMVPASLTN